MKSNRITSAGHSSNTLVSRSQFKPTLFSTDMVKAILDGRKTITRRLKGLKNIDVKATEIIANNGWPKQGNFTARFQFKNIENDGVEAWEVTNVLKSPYKVGDVIWVRETWNELDNEIAYKASPDLFKKTEWYNKIDKAFKLVSLETPLPENCIKWKPSLFMPKSVCRLFLEVMDIRAERLQDITDNDAQKEGVICESFPEETYTGNFCELWQKLNGNWNDNPYVWVITFKVVECPQGFC